MKMPEGIPSEDNTKRKIAVSLDREVFKLVCENAQKKNFSFSDSINDIAKCGILCLQDAGEL